MYHILSAVTARLQQAAASHPSRLHPGGAAPAGGSGADAAGVSNSSGGSAADSSGASLVELLQRLTEGVVGLIEGLAVEKECLESQMLHSGDEARQLRGQVGRRRGGPQLCRGAVRSD